MWSYIVGGVFLALAIYVIVQGIRCGAAVRESKNRLAVYNAQTAEVCVILLPVILTKSSILLS